MNFRSFLKDKIVQIILIIFAVLTIEMFLIWYPLGIFIKIYIPVILFILYFISLVIEYLPKKKFYKNLTNFLNDLDEKYLITEIIKEPNFEEGKLLTDILGQVDKSMIENVNKYKYSQEEYKEYIEMWIHEVKIPIATSKMIIENNKNDITKSIDEEIQKIEDYTEQALYYARSNTANQDYYIRKNNLQEIVNEVIRKNKTPLINEKISIKMENLNLDVNTDSKWIVFILNQIIQNSIKYRKKENLEISFFAKEGKENVVLYVKDNGMGIEKGEISRVFEKGFTGTNGRTINKKSTGIGLYLCKKLCNKLGIGIELSSIKNEGTEVSIIFPKNSYIEMK